MEDIDSSVMLKEKLLSAGIDEIASHGIKNFSLRRVAAACGASCAAPYKHFKNKEDFINEIIMYVEEKWEHLSNQIARVFDDPRERIAQLCVANVRFKIGNPLYGMGKEAFAQNILDEISSLFPDDKSSAEEKHFIISTLIAGTAYLIEQGKLDNSPKTFDLLKKKILSEL